MLIASAWCAACVAHQPTHSVGYAVQGVPILAGSPLSQSTLVIQKLVDERPEPAVNRTAEWALASIQSEGKTWYATSDDRFKLAGSLAYAVTDMIATHLRATQMFRSVQISQIEPPPGDFVLTGRLVEIEGLREERATSENVAALTGLVGAVVKATQTAELRGRTKLEDIKLTQVATGTIVWEGNVEGVVNQNVSVDPNQVPDQVFDAANRSLRLAVDQLVRNIAQADVPPIASSR